MDPAAQLSLNEALDGLWRQFLPQIEERVAVLEAAGRAVSSGRFSNEQREAAHSAAHKLAGVLGTFGLIKGTILAREAESLYLGDTDPESASQLMNIAEQLRVLVASRK